MALALVVGSLLAAAIPVVRELILQPSDVLQDFKLWQLVTTTFMVPPSPMTLIFGVLILLQGGGWLEAQWGTRGVWLFVFVVNLIANVLTVLVGLLSPIVASVAVYGGVTTTEIIWVAQGLIIGPGQTNFWSFRITGYAFAAIGAAFTLVTGLTGGWFAVVPQLFALAITVAWIRGYTPGQLWLRIRSAQLDRDLKRRSSHLSVVKNKPDRDQYLN